MRLWDMEYRRRCSDVLRGFVPCFRARFCLPERRVARVHDQIEQKLKLDV